MQMSGFLLRMQDTVCECINAEQQIGLYCKLHLDLRTFRTMSNDDQEGLFQQILLMHCKWLQNTHPA